MHARLTVENGNASPREWPLQERDVVKLGRNKTNDIILRDEHASRFPRGALAEERSAARVLALCDLGRALEARGAAEAFVRASPNSPLVPRLRGSCALSESNGGKGE